MTVSDRLPPGLLHRPDDDKDRPFTQGPMKMTVVVSEDLLTRTWKIDRLVPRESRRIEYLRRGGDGPGRLSRASGNRPGRGGVQATAADKIELVEPKLEVKIDAPPRKAANVPAPARITVYQHRRPAAAEHRRHRHARPGQGGPRRGRWAEVADRMVQWIIPSLGANTSRVLDLEVSKSDGGRVVHKVSAVYRGLTVPKEAETEFEAVAVLSLDFRGNSPTVEVNGEVTYDLNVRNSGSAAATNIRPVIELPPELTFVSAEPEHKADGGKVVFEPIQSLPAGGRATFRVKTKALKPSLGAAVTAESERRSVPDRTDEATGNDGHRRQPAGAPGPGTGG